MMAQQAAASLRSVQHTVGITLIFGVAVIWTVASFLTQKVVSDVDPFIFTYLGTTLFTLYLPMSVLSKCAKRVYHDRRLRGYHTVQSQAEAEGSDPGHHILSNDPEDDAANDRAFNAAVWVAPLWFLANWFYNVAFLSTSVTSSTILSQTSTLFTFGLAVWLLREHYSNTKLLYVALTILGVVLVTVKDYEEMGEAGGGQRRSVWGDLLCVLGAAMYGLYSVVMRKQLGEEREADLAMFFGYVGLLTTLVLTPIIALLALLGVYSRDQIFIPRSDLGLIVVEGVIDNVLADFLLAKAVLLVGPTLAQLGMSSTIPLAAAGDIFVGLYSKHRDLPAWLRKPRLLALTLLGTLLVVCGFFGFNLTDPGGGGEQQEGGARGGEEGGVERGGAAAVQLATPSSASAASADSFLRPTTSRPATPRTPMAPGTPGTAQPPLLALLVAPATPPRAQVPSRPHMQ